MNFNLNVLFTILLFGIIVAHTQEYNQLVKQKENLIQESKNLTNHLKETQSIQKHTLEALKIVNTQIDVKENILNILEEELDFLKSEEKKIEKELNNTINDLEILKKNYSTLIQNTHYVSLSYNRLLFFLSSEDFNQLVRRIYQFRRIEINRRKKYEAIEELKLDIENKRALLIKQKIAQTDLTSIKKLEIKSLTETKNSKEEMVGVLKNKEDSLMQALEIKREETKRISDEILSILAKEKNKENNLTPELKLLSSDFEANKGRLPWPTEKGNIVSKFGEIPHPVLSGITIMNNGIEIATNNHQVRSVFNGEVTKIIILPNGFKVVIVRHGEYFSVYSNLHDVSVKMGDQIKIKTIIGSLHNIDNKNRNILGFQIWKTRQKLNPANWLSSY